MPSQVINTLNAEHYTWGGPGNDMCDGWHMVKTPALSVIEERMPPSATETRHIHTRSRQFFYVLSGILTMEVEHHSFTIAAGSGIEVHPGQAHTAANHGAGDLRILVTSQPPSHDDRQPA